MFVDSITAISRLSFRWSEQQPEALSERTSKKDIRGAYGLHGREMIAWLHQLQHARGKSVVFVAILEKIDPEQLLTSRTMTLQPSNWNGGHAFAQKITGLWSITRRAFSVAMA